MADEKNRRGTESTGATRLRDQGDGTFAEMGLAAGYSTFQDGTIQSGATAAPIVGTATPAALVFLQNDPEAATNVLVGTATSQSVKLKPGDRVTIPITDASLIYIKAESGSPNVNFHIFF